MTTTKQNLRRVIDMTTWVAPETIEIGHVICLPSGQRGRVTALAAPLWGAGVVTVTNRFTTRADVLPDRVERVTCDTCAGQIADGNGGPAHYPQATCRMGGGRAHCSCAGCW